VEFTVNGKPPKFPAPNEDAFVVRQGFLSEDDVKRLMRYLTADLAIMVWFLFHSTWRAEEAMGLRWSMVHDDGIRLPATNNKNKAPKGLPLAGHIADVIATQRERQVEGCDYVFHRAGKQIRCFDKAFDNACKTCGFVDENGKPRTPHDLRRSGITHLANLGFDRKTIMACSGHKGEGTFVRYHIVGMNRQAEMLDAAKRGQVKAPAKVLQMADKRRRA